MTRRVAALLAVLAMPACHRQPGSAVPDAAAEARAATAGKAADDIAAAEDASRRPIPSVPLEPAVEPRPAAAPDDRKRAPAEDRGDPDAGSMADVETNSAP